MNAESESTSPALLSPVIQNAARIFSIGAMVAIACAVFYSGRQSQQIDTVAAPQRTETFQIDINQADLRELTLMPRIGTLTAQRILVDRNQHGPFLSLSDLQRVPGIGPKTVQEISPYCKVVSEVSKANGNSLLADR